MRHACSPRPPRGRRAPRSGCRGRGCTRSGRGARNPPRCQAGTAGLRSHLTPNECSTNLLGRPMPPTLPPFDAADFQGEITLDRVIPSSPPQYSPLPADLRPELAAALESRGITRLYSHQAESYAEIRRGRPPAVLTPPPRGQTPCSHPPGLPRVPQAPP